MLTAVRQHSKRNRRSRIVIGRRDVAVGRSALQDERFGLIDRLGRVNRGRLNGCAGAYLLGNFAPHLASNHPSAGGTEQQRYAEEERKRARTTAARRLRDRHETVRTVESIRADLPATIEALICRFTHGRNSIREGRRKGAEKLLERQGLVLTSFARALSPRQPLSPHFSLQIRALPIVKEGHPDIKSVCTKK